MPELNRSPAIAIATACALAVAAATVSNGARADDLADLREDVRREEGHSEIDTESPESRPPKKKSRRHSRHPHWAVCWHDDSDDDFATSVVVGTLTAPYWIPAVALGDGYQLKAWFPPAPYAGVDGALVIHSPLPRASTKWVARFRGETAHDFGDVLRGGGSLLLDSTSRFGFDSQWEYRYQNRPVGHDHLWTGDFNVVFRFAQSERAQFRSGLGFNWLSDEVDTDVGFNFTYGADFFPARPWVVSCEIDLGRLGRASLFHGRATVGVVVDRFEIYTGYDYYDVGGTQLKGLIAGVGVWLN